MCAGDEDVVKNWEGKRWRTGEEERRERGK